MLPLLAQFMAPIPVDGTTIQMLGYVTTALDALVAPTSTIFLGVAMPVLNKLGLFALVLGALKWTWDYLTGNHIFIGEVFWKVLVRYLIAYNLLRYYNAPLPLVGYNFHQIFTEEGRWMAAQINVRTLNLFLTQIQQIWANMEKPHIYDLPATLIYLWIAGQMAVVECVLFVITAMSFWCIGIGIILRPFFIVAYLFQATRHYFWAWVNYMIKYSLYRVVAACIVAIFSNILFRFVNNTVAGDYSLGHWWAIALAFCVICVAGVVACLKVGSIVNDLTTGSAHAGASIPVPMIDRVDLNHMATTFPASDLNNAEFSIRKAVQFGRMAAENKVLYAIVGLLTVALVLVCFEVHQNTAAQFTAPIPVDGTTIQVLGYVTTALDALVASTSTIFLGVAMPVCHR